MTRFIAYFGAAFIMSPVVVIIISSFSQIRYITFPPQGFTFDWYAEAIKKSEFVDSFLLSVGLATLVMVCSLVAGVLLCLTLRSLPDSVRNTSLSIVMSPLVLPSIVLGIALLQYFTLIGAGVSLGTLMVGHMLITIPYVVRLIYDSLRALPQNLEWAAASLGASPSDTALRVVIPCIKPGMIGGAIFAFIISFENVTISVFLASPQMMTMPVRIFGYTEQAIETWLIAVCSMTIFFTVAVLWITERLVGIQRMFYSGKA